MSGTYDLYVGLIRAIGTDLTDTIEALRICFGRAGYARDSIIHLKLSRYLDVCVSAAGLTDDTGPKLSEPTDGRFRYYMSRMDAGDWARKTFEPDVLAQCAVAHINQIRQQEPIPSTGRPGRVFVVDSIMHPKEVILLRTVFGNRFFLLGVHSTARDRATHLLDDLRSTDPTEFPSSEPRSSSSGDGSGDYEERQRYEKRDRRRVEQVEILMRRDEGLTDPDSPYSPAPPKLRVAVRKTFSKADVFVSAEEAGLARRGDHSGVLERFVEKVFDEPFHTPTKDELGMAHAYVAARRSGSLARLVGAALCTQSGEVLAVGTNEVPSAYGGQYWPDYDGSVGDQRDHLFEWTSPDGTAVVGVDSSDVMKVEMAEDFARRILAALPSHLSDSDGQMSIFEEHVHNADELVPRLLSDPSVNSAQLFDVIEYSRQVHAEMAALMACARRGVATQGTVLYTTTFPCHECSRHIIAAGVERVVYVEPYEKSRVSELHRDSVEVELYAGVDPDTSVSPSNKVRFEPFLGISPDRQRDLYSFTRRKLESDTPDLARVGHARHWQLGPRSPIRGTIAVSDVTSGVAQLMVTTASEQFVARSLVQFGIHAEDLRRSHDGGATAEIEQSVKSVDTASASIKDRTSGEAP